MFSSQNGFRNERKRNDANPGANCFCSSVCLNKNNEAFGVELGLFLKFLKFSEAFGAELKLVLKGNDDEIFWGKFGVFVFSKNCFLREKLSLAKTIDKLLLMGFVDDKVWVIFS